ncbi:MAG: hypothetical protein JNL67_15305 [Planctomycetaceae bacterium]|nr:hypothetical protein [Planctomycetaceae bacterium]
MALSISCALSFLVALILVRVGRLVGGTHLWIAYVLAANLSGLSGLLVQKVWPRWSGFAPEKRTVEQAWSLIQSTWKTWWAPQAGDQWLFWVMTVMLGCSLLLGFFARRFRTVVGGLVVGGLLFGLGVVLWRTMLEGSVYLEPKLAFWLKAAYVVGPTLVLSLAWLGQWQWLRQHVTASTANHAATTLESRESLVHWLAVLALILSGVLLLASSGTLSLASQLLTFASLPLAWLLEAWLPRGGAVRPLPTPAAATMAGWLTATCGLLVVLGHLFAEVSLALGCLYAVSLWWIPWLWPLASVSAGRKWGLAVLAAAPALLAAGIAAGIMIVQHG